MKSFQSASPQVVLILFSLVIGLWTSNLNAADANFGDPEKSEAASAEEVPASKLQLTPAAVDALGDPLPKGALMRFGTVRFRPPTSTPDLVLSPDNKVIVSSGKWIIAWDTQAGKELWRRSEHEVGLNYSGPRYGSRDIAFTANSSHFYTPGGQKRVAVWDVATGTHKILNVKAGLFDFTTGNANAISVDVTRDEKRIALGSAAGLIVVNQEMKKLFEVKNEKVEPQNFAGRDRLGFFGADAVGRFSPDGSKLAAVVSDRPEEIAVFDVESNKPIHTLKLKARMVRMEYCLDGKQLVATERDNAVRLYDVDSGLCLWERIIELKNRNENYTSAVAVSPDSKMIAVCATDHRIYLLDATTGEIVGQFVGHRAYPWAVTFSSDGQTLYSSGWDGTIRRWDVVSRKPLPPPSGVHATEVVAASPDGRTLAYEQDSGKIRIVDRQTGTDIRVLEEPEMQFSQLVYSPDGKQLAGGGRIDDQVQVVVWDMTTGNVLRRWNWPKGRDSFSIVEALGFSPNGQRLAAATFRQSAAYLWDLTSGEKLAELKHQQIYGLSFSPDGKTLATAGWDSIVRFWETESGELMRELKIAEAANLQQADVRMYAVAYSPGNDFLATAHMDAKVRIWNTQDLTLRTEFSTEGSFVYGAMSFSPNGHLIATGTVGGNVTVYEAFTGQKVHSAGQHQGMVYTVGFGRDSRTVLSGGEDVGGYLWTLNPSSENSTRQSLEDSWNQLASDKAEIAYQAQWALLDESEKAVPLIAEKLLPIKTIFDLDRTDTTKSAEEFDRQKRMKKILIDKDPKVESEIVVRRALAVLTDIGTPAAIEVLKQLSDRDPDGRVGQLSRAALKSLNQVGQH